MIFRNAARVAAALLILFALWFAVRRLPVLQWVVAGAKALHGMGVPGMLFTGLAIYLLSLLLLPVVPFFVACGWLYGPGGSVFSLAAAVASAATAFSLARALGRGATAQALLTRPRARALAELAAEGGILTVALVRLSPILPFTPSNAVMGLLPMRLRDVALGTALGMAPGILLYSWAGSQLPSAEAIEQGETVHGALVWILLAVALPAAAILGTAATRRLRREPARPAGGP